MKIDYFAYLFDCFNNFPIFYFLKNYKTLRKFEIALNFFARVFYALFPQEIEKILNFF